MRLRPPSIGLQWALRYALATLLAISLFSLYVYRRVERRLEREAELVASYPARNVSEAVRRYGDDLGRMEELIDREVRAADPDLRLGIQLYDAEGRLVVSRGVLEEADLPLHPSVRAGHRNWVFFEADLPGSAPYYVVATAPGDHFLQVAIYGRTFARHLDFIADGFLLGLPVALLLTVGLGWLLARGSLRPIARITGTARRIGTSSLDAEVPTTGSGDELDQLAVTLNDMLSRIRESVDRMRRFAGDAAHELRTPLAALRSQIEVTLEKERTPEEHARLLERLLEEVERLSTGVDALLRLARSEAGVQPERRQVVGLHELVETVVDFFGPLAEERGLSLELTRGAEGKVAGDPAWLQQLFANLLHNAIKFTPSGGSVRVDVGEDVEGGGLVVQVRDTGIGIPAEEQGRVFERFHKLDASRSAEGFGLGLSLVRELARAHGGDVGVESEPGEGSTFRVWLPRAED